MNQWGELTNIFVPKQIVLSRPLQVFRGGSAAEIILGEVVDTAQQRNLDVPLTSFSPLVELSVHGE